MSFQSQILTLVHAQSGHIIKSIEPLINPTISDIDKARRLLSANVQGSLSRALNGLTLSKPETKTDYYVHGQLVFVFCIVYYQPDRLEV